MIHALAVQAKSSKNVTEQIIKKRITLVFKAYFLFVLQFCITAKTPILDNIKNFIKIGDYYSLKKTLQMHRLNLKEQIDVLNYAKSIEAKSEQKLSMQSKNLIFSSLFLLFFGVAAYKFYRYIDLSFKLDGMNTINAYLDGEAKPLTAFQLNKITNPIPTQEIIETSRKLDNLGLEILFYLTITTFTGFEGLVGYCFSRDRFILNFLKNKFST